MNNAQPSNLMPKKYIWDWPLRLFHWLLLLCLLAAWYTMEIDYDMDNHQLAGYGIFALLLFRMLWGFAGTYYARFGTFLYGPGRTAAYAKTFFSKKTERHAGHNPLGALAVIAMLLLITLQVVTGLFSSTDYDEGPWYEWISTDLSYDLTTLHYQNFDVLTIVIGIHILAIAFYGVFKRDNLTSAMISGRRGGLSDDTIEIASSKTKLAIGLYSISAIAVYFLIQ